MKAPGAGGGAGRVLVLGGTGAMGMHLCAYLAETGFDVVVTSRKQRVSTAAGITFVKADAKSPEELARLLDGSRWDAIVDFMVWSTAEFRSVYQLILANTDQYVFVSSYRVYADAPVLTEGSPRLLDATDDEAYLATDEYALAKARCEDLLQGESAGNWTIVRPAITFDESGRFQLGTMESSLWLWRACNGVSVPFPAPMLGKRTTLTQGKSVARMIERLVGNARALGEVFNVSTSDSLTWAEVVQLYQSVVPFEVVECDLDDYARERGGVWQIRYDRMFDRVVDNSKVLRVTGLNAADVGSARTCLAAELRAYLDSGCAVAPNASLQAKMDRLVGGHPSLKPLLLGDQVCGNVLRYAKYSLIMR